jgi:CubicO group peptidase (beta-lactamase class C family)
LALEAVTRQPYGDLIKRRIFDRLGLSDSAPTTTHAIRTRVPPGHAPRFDDRPWRPEHGLVPAPWVESAEADGCSCCTVEELAAFARALWREDGSLLSAASFNALKTSWPPDEGWAYGYGLELEPRGFGHGGDMLGHVSHVRVDVESGLGVVACANGFAGMNRALVCPVQEPVEPQALRRPWLAPKSEQPFVTPYYRAFTQV